MGPERRLELRSRVWRKGREEREEGMEPEKRLRGRARKRRECGRVAGIGPETRPGTRESSERAVRRERAVESR